MSSNEYHFVTRWRVPGTAQAVYDLISHPVEFPRWWPQVYLKVEETASGDACGVGHCVRLHTKGWLPYTLRWESCCTEAEPPSRLAIRACGDFEGRGIWTFRQDGPVVDVTFDWQLRADKPLLRYLSFVLKPLFSANHRWAMACGEESLRRELARGKA
jgi:Polyketide cyclase / dehydrase and lipid transport